MNQDLYSFIENHSIIEIKEMLNSTIENCTLNVLNQNKITQKNINLLWIIYQNKEKSDCHIKLLLKNNLGKNV